MNTISQLRNQYKNKQTKVADHISSLIKDNLTKDTQLNAFITHTSELALAQAHKLDAELALNPTIIDSKPLFGVPIAFKDIFLVQDTLTTAASHVLSNYQAQYSATAYKRVTDAGAICIGKLNCDAWAHGSSGENSQFGATHNPWNLDYVPGGSSSGSAVAVSAQMATVTMGSDTGGSIRLPASFCNVVGLKPTYGRVPRYGVISMASSLDSIGHFTQTVEDSAIVLSVTAGQDPYDASTSPAPIPTYHKDLDLPKRKLRIGIPKEYVDQGLDQEVGQVFDKVKSVFNQQLDCEIVPVSLPHTQYGIAVYYIIQTSEVSSNLGRYDGIRYGSKRDMFGDEAKRRVMLGTYVLSAGHHDAYYTKAQQVRTLIKQDFDTVFQNVDALIAPVSPTPPFKLNSKSSDPMQMYLSDILTVTINLAGVPSISIPGGFSSSKLPIGFQIIGPHLSEQLLFQLGHAYQQKTSWHTQNPAI